MMIRWTFSIFALFTLITAISPASAQEKLRLAWAGFSPTNSPIWVIEDRKLMQKQGVEPEIIAISASPTVLQALLANEIDAASISVTTLTRAQIRNGNGGAELGGLTAAQRDSVLRDTPLWFYILREAELGGGKLRGVGARIVAETFHRAMEGSQVSIVRNPTWRPSLGPDNQTFRMVDLLLFAFRGRKNLLAPLGD